MSTKPFSATVASFEYFVMSNTAVSHDCKIAFICSRSSPFVHEFTCVVKRTGQLDFIHFGFDDDFRRVPWISRFSLMSGFPKHSSAIVEQRSVSAPCKNNFISVAVKPLTGFVIFNYCSKIILICLLSGMLPASFSDDLKAKLEALTGSSTEDYLLVHSTHFRLRFRNTSEFL